MKHHFFSQLAALFAGLLTFLPAGAPAATISMQGSIVGLSTPTNPDLSTLDYYFVTALSDHVAQITHAVIAFPVNSGTALDIGIYFPPDDNGDVRHMMTVLSNTDSPFPVTAGQHYILAFRPRNSDFDGYWPLPAVENNGSEFSAFNYNSTLTGDVRLDEIWRGQPDGTFKITIVPEPAISLLAVVGVMTFTLRRRRAVASGVALLACITAVHAERATSTPVELQNGMVRWQTLPGMGYKLRRTNDLSAGQWLTLPGEYFGTGQELATHVYDLPTVPPATSATLASTVPELLVTITAYPNGQSLLQWSSSSGTVAVVTAYDLRNQEGLFGSPILSGFANPVAEASTTVLLKTKRRIQRLPASIQNLTMASSVPPALS